MKIKKLSVFLFSLITLLSGCFETTEDLTIAENGSGTYKTALDFGGIFEMFDALKAMDTSSRDLGFPKERKDTTIRLRDFTDTAATLTAEQKALYKNATVNVVMDEKEKEFKLNIKMPFEKTGDVEKLAKLMGSEEGGNILSKLMKQNKTFGSEDESPGKMPDLNSCFDLSVAKGRLERKLNKVRYDSLMQQFGTQFQAEGMDDMLQNIKMNTVLHLPRAATKITAANATTSADKKTITLKGTFADLIKKPQVFAYRVEY
jgi:hypothetical protein